MLELLKKCPFFDVKSSIAASRYTSFQFKLVMRILTTNVFLNIIRVRENNLCTFCGAVPETLKHLFLTCPVVERFWNRICDYLSEHSIGQMSNKVKMFGDPESQIITHCVTVAKYIIYDARRRSTSPQLSYFKSWLARDLASEEYISRKQGQMESLRKKWSSLYAELRPNL